MDIVKLQKAYASYSKYMLNGEAPNEAILIVLHTMSYTELMRAEVVARLLKKESLRQIAMYTCVSESCIRSIGKQLNILKR